MRSLKALHHKVRSPVHALFALGLLQCAAAETPSKLTQADGADIWDYPSERELVKSLGPGSAQRTEYGKVRRYRVNSADALEVFFESDDRVSLPVSRIVLVSRKTNYPVAKNFRAVPLSNGWKSISRSLGPILRRNKDGKFAIISYLPVKGGPVVSIKTLSDEVHSMTLDYE